MYLDAHSRFLKKLAFKTQEPYVVLQTDGHLFQVKSPRGLRTVSSDNVTDAPVSPVWDAK